MTNPGPAPKPADAPPRPPPALGFNVEPEAVADIPCRTGENPFWHPLEKRLYWVDIPNGLLFRYAPMSRRSERFEIGTPVGGFTIQEDGQLLLFMAKGAVCLWHEGRMRTVIEALPDEQENRFNDVIADPEGRVFCGTMSPPHRLGRLYRLDPDGTISVVLDGVGTSNGLGFSPDLKTLYYTDTRTQEIHIFNYDRTSGAITNRRVFATIPEPDGKPDGLTVDADGCVWSARWDGNCLVRYNPTGKLVACIPFPVRKVSSLTFGGDNLTDIYVTTAGGHIRDTDGPQAGALFHLNVGVRGRPEFLSRIRV